MNPAVTTIWNVLQICHKISYTAIFCTQMMPNGPLPPALVPKINVPKFLKFQNYVNVSAGNQTTRSFFIRDVGFF